MATETTAARKLPLTALLIALLSSGILCAGLIYLNRPVSSVRQDGEATPEAKSYLSNLQLSDVDMQATENFMNQQVVEIRGKIANHGPRKLALVEIYCLFFGMDGREIHRERLAIARGLAAQETRPFRLPFDSLPPEWNQAMPRMAIARISFAN